MAKQGKGYAEMDAAEFVGLPDFYNTVWDVENALRALVKELRTAQGLTQEQAAKLIGTTRSNVAAVEGGNPRYGVELTLKLVCALGATREQISSAIARKTAAGENSKNRFIQTPPRRQRGVKPTVRLKAKREKVAA